MYEQLKIMSYFGLSQEEKKEMISLKKEIEKYKDMDKVGKSNSASNSGSEDN